MGRNSLKEANEDVTFGLSDFSDEDTVKRFGKAIEDFIELTKVQASQGVAIPAFITFEGVEVKQPLTLAVTERKLSKVFISFDNMHNFFRTVPRVNRNEITFYQERKCEERNRNEDCNDGDFLFMLPVILSSNLNLGTKNPSPSS
ncbi:hypothetical protein GCK72_017881 [Caenorhabditis remanei]|uniref:Uncharacterized protein n=1 Tax=Caenorhabditis remanei TaxID=31234 RepID=A0A6A5G8G3_CAERE|nr:hypothetical protein GCK72_017881 [Caenorhabditis remanei]KAF1751327.1 hypothetical protein GCK72_017881 [Caenorhabditis remanei]